MNGLPVMATAPIVPSLACWRKSCSVARNSTKLWGPQRVRPGVILAVIQRDEGKCHSTAGQGDVANIGVGDHFILGVFEEGADIEAVVLSNRTLAHLLPSCVVRVLPNDAATLAKPDTHCCESIADLGVQFELAGELNHEPHTGGGEGGAPGAIAPPQGFTRGSSSAIP